MYKELINTIKNTIKEAFDNVAYFDNDRKTYDRYAIILNEEIHYLSEDFLSHNGVQDSSVYSMDFIDKYNEMKNDSDYTEITIEDLSDTFITSLFSIFKERIRQLNGTFFDHLKEKDSLLNITDSLNFYKDDIRLFSKIRESITSKIKSLIKSDKISNEEKEVIETILDVFINPKEFESLTSAIEYVNIHESLDEKTKAKTSFKI